jgi:hypothetical protein
LLVFTAIGPRAQYRYAHPAAHLRVCICRVTESFLSPGRLPHRDLRCWFPLVRLCPSRRSFLCGHIRCAIEPGPSCLRLSALFVLALRVLLRTTAHVKDTPLPPFTSESVPHPNGTGTVIPTCSRSFSLHRIFPPRRTRASSRCGLLMSHVPCTVLPDRRAQVGLYAGR